MFDIYYTSTMEHTDFITLQLECKLTVDLSELFRLFFMGELCVMIYSRPSDPSAQRYIKEFNV